jgi:hypothetical protein
MQLSASQGQCVCVKDNLCTVFTHTTHVEGVIRVDLSAGPFGSTLGVVDVQTCDHDTDRQLSSLGAEGHQISGARSPSQLNVPCMVLTLLENCSKCIMKRFTVDGYHKPFED